MKKSKYIESWYIQEYQNGIFSILFNTTERWIPYHAYNDTMYLFGQRPNQSIDEWDSSIEEVPEFLPPGKMFMRTVIQEKDQITFYFFPFDMLKKSKLLYERDSA